MSEECIICGKSGGCYAICGSLSAGPYCSQHRWELSVYVYEREKSTVKDRFNMWVEEFLKLKKDKVK